MDQINQYWRLREFRDLAKERIWSIRRGWELLGGDIYGAVGLGELSSL